MPHKDSVIPGETRMSQAYLCRSKSPVSSSGEDTALCRGLMESGSRPAATSEGSIKFSLPLTCTGEDPEQFSRVP